MAQALRPSRVSGRQAAAGQQFTRSDLLPNPRHFRGRHHAATILVVLLLAVVGFRLFPEKDVTVLSNGQSYRVSATFQPREEALSAANVALQPGDRVLYGTGGSHASVAVQRARPVTVEADGSVVEVRTQATTIAGALADAGVDLRPNDRVSLDGQLATARGPLFGVSLASRATPALAAATGSSGGVHITITRARPVTVYVDTLRVDTTSAADTVDGLLGELGMTVREGDLVRPGLGAPLSAGLTVRLAKARTITVRLDGKDQSLYTQATTVGDVLRLLGVDPGPDEILTPSRETIIASGMTVVIGLTKSVIEDVSEPISPPTVYDTDPDLASGSVRVVQGTPGVRVTKWLVTYKNGVEVERTVAAGGGVVEQPSPTRHIMGTKAGSPSRPTLSAAGYDGVYKQKLTVRTTWYNASGGGKSRDDPGYGRTATGAMVDYGICAVDPSIIPLGTRFYVPNYGMCVAADTGGAIKGMVVDLGFPESAGDTGWGNPVVEIYIID